MVVRICLHAGRLRGTMNSNPQILCFCHRWSLFDHLPTASHQQLWRHRYTGTANHKDPHTHIQSAAAGQLLLCGRKQQCMLAVAFVQILLYYFLQLLLLTALKQARLCRVHRFRCFHGWRHGCEYNWCNPVWLCSGGDPELDFQELWGVNRSAVDHDWSSKHIATSVNITEGDFYGLGSLQEI